MSRALEVDWKERAEELDEIYEGERDTECRKRARFVPSEKRPVSGSDTR